MPLAITVHKKNPHAVRITDTATGKQIFIRLTRFTSGQARLLIDGDEKFAVDRVPHSTLALDAKNGSVLGCSIERVGKGKRELDIGSIQ